MVRFWRLRRLPLVAAASALAAVFIGVTAAAGSGSAVKPTLTLGDGVMCIGLWFNQPDERSGIYTEFLIRLRGDGTLAPGLATSWKVKPGNKIITFTLRRNARFSDGAVVDAQAIKTYLLDYQVKLRAPT